MADETTKQEVKGSMGKGMGVAPDEPFCPVCLEKGFKEKLNRVIGLIEIAPNPQVEKGAPRVVDCTGGCRYGLEPYFNPRSDGRFCYMVIRSERDPESVVNHYWFDLGWIGPAIKK
jgi:hypothetical protein